MHSLSVRALLLLGLWHTGKRSLASAPELQAQPRKIGELWFSYSWTTCLLQAAQLLYEVINNRPPSMFLDVLIYVCEEKAIRGDSQRATICSNNIWLLLIRSRSTAMCGLNCNHKYALLICWGMRGRLQLPQHGACECLKPMDELQCCASVISKAYDCFLPDAVDSSVLWMNELYE